MGRTLVVGDIHGAYRALVQVLERSKFDPDQDSLICLGDVADGWPDVPKCFDLLSKIPRLTYVMGNHDEWFKDWYEGSLGYIEFMYTWLPHGGQATFDAYEGDPDNVPASHRAILDNAAYYYTMVNDKDELCCFVHGGFHPDSDPTDEHPSVLMWNRDLPYYRERVKQFDYVFIGHTTHRFVGPLKIHNVYNLDSGAGWGEVLTIMDISTKEAWVSDPVTDLYKGVRGR